MREEHDFEQFYRTGDTPWDIGKPDDNLIHTVTATPVRPCKALEMGCGTGDNAIWLAQQNFRVLGIDVSEAAIEKAREKASSARVRCAFLAGNLLTSSLKEAPFGFAFDRGCFHVFESDKQRRRFAEIVSRHLEKDGLWLSLVGNADERRDGLGPPKRSAREISSAVEPFFEILSLVSGSFGSNRPNPPRAWVCLMRKRRRTRIKS